MGKLIFCLLFIVAVSTLTAQVKEINYDWKTIKAAEGKVNLKEIKKWGGVNAGKEELFKYPGAICMDSRGNYYICDAQENQIFVFNKEGKRISVIGRPGSGPGDLNFPSAVEIDSKGNLYVGEDGNNRLQVFNNGKSIMTMNPKNSHYYRIALDNKGRIALSNSLYTKGSPFINLYDLNKKEVGSIGKFDLKNTEKGISVYYAKGRSFDIDNEGNFILGNSYGKPVIEKYSSSGNVVMRINLQLAGIPEEVKMNGGNISGGNGPGIRNIGVDDQNRVYVLVQKRTIQKEDFKYVGGMTMSGSKSGERYIGIVPPKERKEKYDYFALIVFDKDGKLIGMKSLDFFVTNLQVTGGYVFLFDMNTDYVIHQFKY